MTPPAGAGWLKQYLCSECGQSSIARRADGLYECGCCGHIFKEEPLRSPALESKWSDGGRHYRKRKARGW